MKRLERVREKIQGLGLDALLVTQAENRRYLSGFNGSAGCLLISAKEALLATDFRYVEQARRQARGFEVVLVKGELPKWLPGMVVGRGWRRLGFEAQDLSYALYRQLVEAFSSSPVELIPTQGIVEELRGVKEKEELALIEKAAKIVDDAIAHISEIIHPGMREQEAAWELEKFLRERGSQSLPFEPIVASGLNSALPHARPSGHRLEARVPIIIDIGVRVEGYCCDITRTVFLGVPNPIYRKVYETVLEAQARALENIKPGMTGEEADRLSREFIEQAGYGQYFGHGLGHGVGLAVHEFPRLGPESKDELKEGMAFTIEPGIYIPDWGGVRVEDTVILEKGKVRQLTQSPKFKF